MKNRASSAASLRRSSVHSPHVEVAVCHILNLPAVNKHHTCNSKMTGSLPLLQGLTTSSYRTRAHPAAAFGMRVPRQTDGTRGGSCLEHRTPGRKRVIFALIFTLSAPSGVGYDTLSIKLQLLRDALGRRG